MVRVLCHSASISLQFFARPGCRPINSATLTAGAVPHALHLHVLPVQQGVQRGGGAVRIGLPKPGPPLPHLHAAEGVGAAVALRGRGGGGSMGSREHRGTRTAWVCPDTCTAYVAELVKVMACVCALANL